MKIIRKMISMLLIIGIIVQASMPIIVSAEGNNSNCDTVTIAGEYTVSDNDLNHSSGKGKVNITKNNSPVTDTTFSVVTGDKIVITLTANLGYVPELRNGDIILSLTDNKYEFTIGNATENVLTLTPSFNVDELGEISFDFTINGQSFTNVKMGADVIVPSDFNMGAIEEFYVTKAVLKGKSGATLRTYTYDDEEYSYELLDSVGRKILETSLTKVSDSYGYLRSIAHPEDILPADIAAGKTNADYYGFYILRINFLKAGFKGVEVSTETLLDNYDFTKWNGVDLSTSTESNPGVVTAYYDENVINFNSITSSKIKSITLVGDSVPSSAVNIDNETGNVTVLSNFYNEITFKIELEDNTVGYIKVNRTGIFIDRVNKGLLTFYHGAQAMVDGNMNFYTDKNRIAAVFYHGNTTSRTDYDLIANITYADGTTKTVIAEAVSSNPNSFGSVTGSNYIIWKGDKEQEPLKVSVTAVKKGSIDSDATTFNGVTFGSGAGVEWSDYRGGEE